MNEPEYGERYVGPTDTGSIRHAKKPTKATQVISWLLTGVIVATVVILCVSMAIWAVRLAAGI